MSEFPNFKPMQLSDRSLIEKYICVPGLRGSECAFTNHYVWRDYWDVQWCIFRDGLIFKLSFNGEDFFVPPLGLDERDYSDCAKLYREYMGNKFSVRCVYEQYLPVVHKMFPEMKIEENRNLFDYIYLQSELSNFSGRKFHGQKNHYNAFCKDHPDYVYEPITEKNWSECLKFGEEWCNERLTIDSSIMYEKFALQNVFSDFDKLDLRGGAIRFNGAIQAFSIGKKINDDTAVLHFEKAKSGVRGLYIAICKEFASHAWNDVKFLNREEDMGLKGLRKAKENLHPVFMWKKYSVVPK